MYVNRCVFEDSATENIFSSMNQMPDIVVTAANVRVFKSRLDSVDLSYAMVGKP